MQIGLIGTWDTKSSELNFVRELFTTAGHEVVLLDFGTHSAARQELFSQVNVKFGDLQDRGESIRLSALAAEKLAKKLHADGRLDALFGLGGSAGTTIGTAAMRALPFGVPKVMVSTLASGQVQPYVGTRDIVMVHSVADLAGLNRITRQVLFNAANSMLGMLAKSQPTVTDDKPIITATMFGVTTPCVQACRLGLETAGYEVLTFHATGIGGRTMEGLIRDKLVAGVLDLTTTELADELIGGVMSAGPDRLTAASLVGIPQVISVGALDMVNFGPRDTVPAKFQGRQFYEHNPTVTLMRTTPEENDLLGKELAQKACAANSPVAILLPLRGISALDREGQPFWNPEANAALFQSLRNWVYGIELIEIDAHINDSMFAEVAMQTLLRLMACKTTAGV
ncbi:MAG: Tm-1-like ATP-binding domain-containing protein [Fimbriiglobus sp.]